MQEIFIGEAIRQRRLALGLTQEELCEGLCEPATLSRIENGRQAPSRSRANALLQRLGLPHDRYYVILTPKEAEADSLQESINTCLDQFERTLGDDKLQAKRAALDGLEKLDMVIDDNDHIIKQYILAKRAVLGTVEGPYDFDTQLSMLLRAICMTVPGFAPQMMDGHLYSLDETEIINQIGAAYSLSGQNEKAAGIFGQLLSYVQGHYEDVTRPSRYLSLISHNYARELCLLGHYEKAIEIAEVGRMSCLKYGYCQFLPGLLAIAAKCWYFLKEEEKSKERYLQAYYLYQEIGNSSGMATVSKEALEYLNLKLTE